ncbi:MAG: hypothetical protein NTW30_06050 [Candidatus Aenigmarchaeota archaeon]|nr:hypothetical protein [Candidatus Aenigmarchaeota archaeon]
MTWQCSNNQPKSTPSTSCDTACCKSLGGTCKRTVCDIPQPSMNNISLNITNGHGQIRSAMVSLYAPNNSTILNSSNINGYGTLSTTNPIIDLKIDFDSSVLNTLLKNVNITKLSGKSEIVMDSLIPTIPNVRVHKAYKISVPSGFPFTGITLKIKYSGLSVNNEQNLTIYRCGSYNDSTNTCNEQWTNKTTTRVNGFASTELTSFSVYVLGEPQITTTTTTSTTTTTTTESSNNDNSYSGSSYSDGGIYTTTTIRTATTVTECTCNSWSNLACGESPCDQTQMKQQRTCNPSGCNIESQCIVDNSCVTAQQVNETGNEITSQYTGLFVLPDFSQYIYPISGIIILAGAGIAVWKLNGRIKGIFPSYKFSSGKPSKKGHVTVNVESPKYLEVKMKEQPKMEVIKPEEQPKINVESRNKSMEEMRNRALEMDKKIKRK